MQEIGHRVTDGFTDERRHRIANDSELMGAGDRKLEPVRECLRTRCLTGRERALLRGMDEHEPVLAEVRDNGAAWSVAMLAGIAVLERGLVIRELELDTPSHRFAAVIPLCELGKVPEISLAMGAGFVSS